MQRPAAKRLAFLVVKLSALGTHHQTPRDRVSQPGCRCLRVRKGFATTAPKQTWYLTAVCNQTHFRSSGDQSSPPKAPCDGDGKKLINASKMRRMPHAGCKPGYKSRPNRSRGGRGGNEVGSRYFQVHRRRFGNVEGSAVGAPSAPYEKVSWSFAGATWSHLVERACESCAWTQHTRRLQRV